MIYNTHIDQTISEEIILDINKIGCILAAAAAISAVAAAAAIGEKNNPIFRCFYLYLICLLHHPVVLRLSALVSVCFPAHLSVFLHHHLSVYLSVCLPLIQDMK